MRIPSQLNDDNLYRRRIPRGESARTFRRLIRLVIGLTLVVVVMRQAAQPAVYRTFFGPVTTEAGGAAAKLPSAVSNGSHLVGNGPQEPWQVKHSPKDRQFANQVVEQLPREEQIIWMVALSRSLHGLKVEKIPDSIDTIVQTITSDPTVDLTQREAWQQAIGDIAGNLVSSETGKYSGLEQKHAFLAALDNAAASRVIDGSVWRSADFDRFYRCLDEASQMPHSGIAAVGVLPLLQQPEVFLDQLVTIHGTVARAERIDARENPYKIDDYWQLWLKPSEGADRPIVAIVPDAPQIVTDIDSETTTTEGPQITVVGRFLKRLAYKSGAGADLTPVVVGRITYAPFANNEQPLETSKKTVSTQQFWVIISLSCLFGIILAAILMWRTAATANRTRELRSAYRQEPDEFLKGLVEQTSPHSAGAKQEHP